MITSVILESIVIIFDKYAINNVTPKNTSFVLLVENALILVGLFPILFVKEKHFYKDIFNNKMQFFLIGILNAGYTLLGFTAVEGGSVAVVSTIFKTQLLFVLLFSYIFFKDKSKLETIIGSVIIIIGVVIIKIST
jgi:uncharacterized membrane protein